MIKQQIPTKMGSMAVAASILPQSRGTLRWVTGTEHVIDGGLLIS